MSFLVISIKASPYHALRPKELAVGSCPDLWGGGEGAQSLKVFQVWQNISDTSWNISAVSEISQDISTGDFKLEI